MLLINNKQVRTMKFAHNKRYLLVIIALFLIALSNHSQGQNQEASGCIYNGETYAQGTVIGPYICQDGKWVLP